MARPKNPTGVNEVCATCACHCKQSATVEVVSCPSYLAQATPAGIEAALAEDFHKIEHQRAGRKAGTPKNES